VGGDCTNAGKADAGAVKKKFNHAGTLTRFLTFNLQGDPKRLSPKIGGASPIYLAPPILTPSS